MDTHFPVFWALVPYIILYFREGGVELTFTGALVASESKSTNACIIGKRFICPCIFIGATVRTSLKRILKTLLQIKIL